MKHYTLKDMKKAFKGKRVCIVASAPSCLENNGEFIDSFDEVIRVNNYKTMGVDKRGRAYDYTDKVGKRTDYHFSFYGGSVRKTQYDLKGIKAHLCKCPRDVCHVTEWHKNNNQLHGGDFRPLYRRREGFWIAPVYIPHKDHYLECFKLLGGHVPSTGFYCIWEIMQCQPKELYLTGFDFMTSKLHNVDETWKAGREDDPIKHVFDVERELLRKWYYEKDWITVDAHLKGLLV